MSSKWVIQDIVPRSRHREPQDDAEILDPAPDIPNLPPHTPMRAPNKSTWIIWIIALAILAILAFGFTLYFSGATLEVYPKNQTVTVNAEVTGYQEPAAGQLGFELLTITKEGTYTAPATGSTTEVSTRATGTVIVYNNTDKPQTLIKNTRFATAQNLIFRIQDVVTIPPRRTENGQTAAGSIEVPVTADQAGNQYDIPPSDFKLPGLKDSAQYDQIYGRSKSPMQGGAQGVQAGVDQGTADAAQQKTEAGLKQQLLAAAKAQVPAGFVLYDTAIFMSFAPSAGATENGTVTFTDTATLRGVMFRASDLAQFIAAHTIPGYAGEPVTLGDPRAATLKPGAAQEPWTSGQFNFTLSGNPQIVWIFDATKLQHDLVGVAKQSVPSVLSGYPGIDHAVAVIRPFWVRSFPKNPAGIQVKTIIEPGKQRGS